MKNRYIKARCALHNKWFTLELADTAEGERVVNFVAMTEEESKSIETTAAGSSFRVADSLRHCAVCGSDKAGCCSHTMHKDGSRCAVQYNYQCLFCDQLRISNAKAEAGAYGEWVGVSNIPGAACDAHGNPAGSQYDLARDGGFAGQHIVILCLYTGENILTGICQTVAALEKKGFSVDLCTSVTPAELKKKLQDACQLWVVSDSSRRLDGGHLEVIRAFWEAGYGLYILGDNEPYYADANYISKALAGVTMSGNDPGDRVIGVQEKPGGVGLIAGHPISTGIVNLYEGITIATVETNQKVRPLMNADTGKTVTAIVEEDGRRMLIDGGYTRLYFKWDTAGTDRFVVNCAAWLAGGTPGGEYPFT